MIESGVPFDARFATGIFLFRAGNLAACADATLCPVTFASLDRLARDPPDFILTGFERGADKTFPRGLDGTLDQWAQRSGYRHVDLGNQHGLWSRIRRDKRSSLSNAPIKD